MTITGTTSVYALLADPVRHVKTPEMLNARLAAAGIDTVVIPLHVSPKDLAGLVSELRSWQNLAGVGVTIPHKERMTELLDECTDAALRCGATNVVRRTEEGRLVGTQLDGAGLGRSLTESGVRVHGSRALLVGAGGTAKAIAYDLADRGLAELVISNRTMTRAEELTDRLAATFPDTGVTATALPAGDFDLIVNASSLGMHSEGPLPVDRSLLSAVPVVADVVMDPPVTPLLAAAQGAGCPVHPGQLMLEAQFAATVGFLGLRASAAAGHQHAEAM